MTGPDAPGGTPVMVVFGTGLGDPGDACAFCTVVLLVLGTVAVAAPGIVDRSAWAAAASATVAALVGAVVVGGAVTHELRDTDDSRDVHAMLWAFVRWWAFSLAAPAAAAARLLIPPGRGGQTDRTPPALTPVEPGQRLGRRGSALRVILARTLGLLALGGALVLVATFAR